MADSSSEDHENAPDGYAEISVIDDGVGMNFEELSILKKLLESDDTDDEDKNLRQEALVTAHDSTKGGSHFGLYSVGRRIKLYFGKEYGASISSKENEGTTVVIRVPFGRMTV